MVKKLMIITCLFASLVFMGVCISFAQDANQVVEKNGSEEVEWLWGEIVSVNTGEGSFLVKYVDYDTDTEKEMTIYTNEKTVFENVKDLSEIKELDTVSVDYLIDANKSFAKNVSVVKVEELTDTEVQAPANVNVEDAVKEVPATEETKIEEPVAEEEAAK